MSYKSTPINARGLLPDSREMLNPVNITWENAQKEDHIIIARVCRKNFTPAFGTWQIESRDEYVAAMLDGAQIYRVSIHSLKEITSE